MYLPMTLLARLLQQHFAHLDATTVLSRKIVEQGIYPAVDPLESSSRILEADVVGEEHYNVARRVQEIYYRSTENFRILLQFLVWKSFQMKISLLYTEQERFRDSFLNHSL